ncbi:MAG TPA: universal stress protein [Burkholderiaceae bacterium]|nr:universal stress protein [Burkholderiaceae bacterium]
MTALRHIIVATDFTEAAGHAAHRAALLAQQSGATLTLAHVTDDRIWHRLRAAISEPLSSETAARDALEHQREALAKSHSIPVQAHELTGAPAALLAAYAATVGADLLVAGRHGADDAARLIIGSVALGLVRVAPCPVLLPRDRPQRPYRAIAIGVDFSEASARITRRVHQWFERTPLHLVHAYPLPLTPLTGRGLATADQVAGWKAAMKADAQRGLDAFARDCGLAEPVHRHAVEGNAADLLLATAAQAGADLIVVGRHTGSRTGEIVVGSTTQSVLYLASRDVLVAPV